MEGILTLAALIALAAGFVGYCAGKRRAPGKQSNPEKRRSNEPQDGLEQDMIRQLNELLSYQPRFTAKRTDGR